MKKLHPVFWAFLFGLIMGILWPNLFLKSAWKINGTADILVLQKCLEESSFGKDYFWYLLKQKGVFYLFAGLMGISIFGVPVGFLGMAGMGFYIGALLTSMLLVGGIQELFFGLAMLVPQYFFYLPVSMSFFDNCIQMSMGYWKNISYYNKNYIYYFVRMLGLIFLIVLGVFMESYVNPVILKFLLKKFKFF
ncbi:MAG: stage II sporulation protein M [Lachnospiraceae bacterium]|nr:stage II sporulation protein M [Lachnospiraceae bacterium]